MNYFSKICFQKNTLVQEVGYFQNIKTYFLQASCSLWFVMILLTALNEANDPAMSHKPVSWRITLGVCLYFIGGWEEPSFPNLFTRIVLSICPLGFPLSQLSLQVYLFLPNFRMFAKYINLHLMLAITCLAIPLQFKVVRVGFLISSIAEKFFPFHTQKLYLLAW